LKILSHKNAIKAFISGSWGQKPLKFSGFLLLEKKKIAYFASKLKILSLKNAIKALQLCHFRWGLYKPCKFEEF
jgi:hypothetical protein